MGWPYGGLTACKTLSGGCECFKKTRSLHLYKDTGKECYKQEGEKK